MLAIENCATARARSRAGNQYVKYRTMPGKNPASAAPSRKRKALKLAARRRTSSPSRRFPTPRRCGRSRSARRPARAQIAGHFEQEVAEEEDAGAAAVLERRQPERGVHLQRGEADVDAIEVGDEIQQCEKRNQHGGVTRARSVRSATAHRSARAPSSSQPASNSLQPAAGAADAPRRRRDSAARRGPGRSGRPKQPSSAATRGAMIDEILHPRIGEVVEVLEHLVVRRRDREMDVGHRADRSADVVRRQQQVVRVGPAGQVLHRQEAAEVREVHLDDVGDAGLDELADVGDRVRALAGRDRDPRRRAARAPAPRRFPAAPAPRSIPDRTARASPPPARRSPA